ncbi:MAG: molybdopterin-dependent oxidoreductase [Deltaproteobacteria bacterium]|nr:molybdopterin-dependent oxidoreductase [Deltaproteobacteria bacterium]
MTARRHIGKATPRPDGPDKAAGRALYIHDLARPGMLYGKVKFSEHAHARIRSIDTAAAERVRGVRAVLTARNTPELRFGFLRDNLVLKRDKVRQFRDEVAAVAAVDPEAAAEAVDRIRVEYEPLAGVFTPEEALRDGAPLVHEADPQGRPRRDNRVPLRFHHESGDLAAAERASRHVVEGTFSTPRIQQGCMGTAGCIAEFDRRGHLTIWAKTQIPFLAQRDFTRFLADLGLGERDVRVIVPTLGGAFGSGLDTHAYEYLAILLAWKAGRAVKIVYTREEEFACLSPRQCTVTRIAQGCDAEGRLTFRRVDVLQDNGAYTSWGATYPSVMMVPVTSLYRVPAVHFDAQIVYTNNTYCQAMRGYGNPEVNWAIESNLDDLAHAAGIDPLEVRLRNCNEPGEVTPMGLKVGTCGLRECLERTAARLDWPARRAGPSKPVAGVGTGKRRGLGLASLCHVGGSGRIYRSDASGVVLRLDDFGFVHAHYGGVEMGQGLHSVLTLAVAEALGVRPEKVIVGPTDTAHCPWDVGTHASRGAFMACTAVLRAADELRRRIFELARAAYPAEAEAALARHRRRDPEYRPPDFDVAEAARSGTFELQDGFLFLREAPPEPWLRVELARFLRAVHFREGGEMLSAESFVDPPTQLPDFERGFGNLSAAYAYGTQGAEVEVDEETGEVRVLRLVAVHDVGAVLNPQTLAGQMYGALAQGLGYALYEEVLSERGRILNPDFRDYKLPTAHELGMPIELEFVEPDEPAGPFGAKGVGESGLVPTAPAIANAIHDAVGVRLYDLPLRPERVLEALRKRRV